MARLESAVTRMPAKSSIHGVRRTLITLAALKPARARTVAKSGKAAAWRRSLNLTHSRCLTGLIASNGTPKMILKSTAFLFAAFALTGCCVSGNGCYSPLPGPPVAWDALGSRPNDGTVPTELKLKKQSKIEAFTEPGFDAGTASDARPHAPEGLAQREASDRAAESALTKKLIICRGCSVPPARDDDLTGSVPH
jgi:hypothetical protein